MFVQIRERLVNARQAFAILVAFLLPISTSGEAIAVGCFVILSLLTIDTDRWQTILRSPTAAIPIALFVLIAVSMLWSPQPFGPGGTSHYLKLLLIPLVMATAFTPRQALHVGYGFVAACTILLVLSLASMIWPSGPWSWFKSPGIPVKDNAIQSSCFALCAFGLSLAAVRNWGAGKRRQSGVTAVLALLFFADVFLIYLSKTGILVAAALLALFLIKISNLRRILLTVVPLILIACAAVWFSPLAQLKFAQFENDTRALTSTSSGLKETRSTASRLDFWRKAIELVGQAPLIGHGAGSTKSLYQAMEADRPSPYGEAVPDPHNQFLAIAIQAGLVGGALLIAMWVAHFIIMMLPGRGFAAVLGQAIVIQNVIESLFNSPLSQVTQGTLYCLATGLLAGLLQGTTARSPRSRH